MTDINIILSIPSPRFSEEQQEAFSRFGSWNVLNERGNRLLIDAVGPEENLQAALAALGGIGRNPHIIGSWRHNGQRVHPLDEQHWLSVAPDEVDASDPENLVHSRPTQFHQVHSWQGWADKV